MHQIYIESQQLISIVPMANANSRGGPYPNETSNASNLNRRIDAKMYLVWNSRLQAGLAVNAVTLLLDMFLLDSSGLGLQQRLLKSMLESSMGKILVVDWDQVQVQWTNGRVELHNISINCTVTLSKPVCKR